MLSSRRPAGTGGSKLRALVIGVWKVMMESDIEPGVGPGEVTVELVGVVRSVIGDRLGFHPSSAVFTGVVGMGMPPVLGGGPKWPLFRRKNPGAGITCEARKEVGGQPPREPRLVGRGHC